MLEPTGTSSAAGLASPFTPMSLVDIGAGVFRTGCSTERASKPKFPSPESCLFRLTFLGSRESGVSLSFGSWKAAGSPRRMIPPTCPTSGNAIDALNKFWFLGRVSCGAHAARTKRVENHTWKKEHHEHSSRLKIFWLVRSVFDGTI